MSKTLGDLVEFVLANRRGNAFKDYTENQIAEELFTGCNTGVVFYCVNATHDGIIGVVSGLANPKARTLHICNLLTTEKWAMKRFIEIYREKFTGYALTARRYGIEVEYNTEKLYNKLMKGKV